MREPLGASDLAIRFVVVMLGALFASCNAAKPADPTERRAPPRVLEVTMESVVLRANAYVELHAWLAAAARSNVELPDPVLQQAAHVYATVLDSDPRDDALWATMRALSKCVDSDCAASALSASPFGKPYLDALPVYLARFWTQRAAILRAGMETAQSALGEALTPLIARLSKDLALEWPKKPPVVEMVVDTPEPAREAPIRMALTARGSCFAGTGAEASSMHDARIVDCVLAYAAIEQSETSELGIELRKALTATGHGDDFARAWQALVVNAVAVVVSALDRSHSSTLRRSAVAIMPQAMEWLAYQWPSRMRGEPPASFAKRYAEVITGGSP